MSYQYFNENPVYVRTNFKLLKPIHCAAAVDNRLTPVHPYWRQQSRVTDTLVIATIWGKQIDLELDYPISHSYFPSRIV